MTPNTEKNTLKTITSAVFEIVPHERLSVLDPIEVFTNFAESLEGIGYTLKEKRTNFLLFEVQDKDKLSKIAFSELGYYKEYYWFAAEYCQYLLIASGEYDVLFALASERDPNEEGPYDTPAHYISTQIMGPISPPTIARMLTSRALWETGSKELAEQINCTSNSPNETALMGSISFAEHPSSHLAGVTIDDETYHPLTILDTSRLNPQNIVSLFRKVSLIDDIEIAKALPVPLTYNAITDEDGTRPYSKVQNHFSIGARFGTLKPVLRQMMEISLHLNWSLSSDRDEPVDHEKVFKFAMAQRSRLRELERTEERLQFSLDLLQKSYPDRVEILEWKINNIYTNTIRYSPVYLSSKASIETFLSKGDQWQIWLKNRLAELDWQFLITNKSATSEDIEKLIKLSQIDPSSALTKMRVIVEKILQLIYKRAFPNQSFPVFADMIKRLDAQKTFPPIIFVCLNALRQAGNIGAHDIQAQSDDTMAIIPLFIRIVEWFVEYERQNH